MVIDLAASKSTATGEFSGNITLKQGGKEEPHTYATLELAFSVDEESAEELDRVLPGASALFKKANVAAKDAATAERLEGAAAGAEAASKGTFGEVKVRIPHTDYEFTLSNDDVAVTFGAEIRSIRLKATPKAKKYLIKLDTGPMDGSDIGALAELLLDDVITVSTVHKGQQVLPFTGPEQNAAAIGQVISGIHDGTEYAGIVVGHVNDEDSGKMVEIDDFGDHYVVPIGTIAGSIKVVGDKGSALGQVALQDYVDTCNEANSEISWRFLVPALGRAYLNGTPAGDEWPLTSEVIADACNTALQRASA